MKRSLSNDILPAEFDNPSILVPKKPITRWFVSLGPSGLRCPLLVQAFAEPGRGEVYTHGSQDKCLTKWLSSGKTIGVYVAATGNGPVVSVLGDGVLLT